MVTLKKKAGQYHHGQLKGALIAAGRVLLEQRGLRGFTLRECARRARVSYAAPAHHFSSVGDLLGEIAAEGFEELAAAMDTSATNIQNPGRRLVALGRGYIDFAIANKALFQLMFNREAHTYKNERLTRAAEAAYAQLAGGVDGVWQNSSVFTKQTISDLAWAGVHGFAMLVLEDQLGRDEARNPAFRRRRDSLLEAIVTAITQGKADRN